MPQQIKIVLVQPQRLSHLLYLLYEMVRRPQAAVIGLVTVIRVQLVIINEFDALLRQKILETFECLMRPAGTAMQQQYFDPGIIAKTFGPDMELSLRRR